MTVNYYMGLDPDKSGSALAMLGYDPDTREISVGALGIIHGHKTSLNESSYLQARFLCGCMPGLIHKANSRILGIFIEGQSMNMGREKGVRYQDIRDLAQISGVLFGVLSVYFFPNYIDCKEPSHWKQQTPKPVQQGRTLNTLGWKHEILASYAKPQLCPKMVQDLSETVMIGMDKSATTEWRHVLDAMGMALFLIKKENPRHFL